ncbi:MAG: polysaccharide lyase [Actinomycetota bacterium]
MTPSPTRSLVITAVTAMVWMTAAPALGETVATRPFEDEIWNEDPSKVEEVADELGLADLRSLDLSRTQLTSGYAGRGLHVGIPTDGFRGFGPFDRLEPLDDASQAPNEVWYRYHVRPVSWNAASTGKLPGVAGIYGSSGRGCIPSTETNPGWSARGLFGAPGTQGASAGRVPIGIYLYHVNQAGDCGDSLWWNASLEQGRWHCIEGSIRINTPGRNDGLIRGWLDGDLKLARDDIQYRRAGEDDVGVRQMWHNVYFGGRWPTPNPLSLQYDEVVVSTSGRVGCLPAFTDIGETMHTNSIRELHALGYLYGCDYRKACPTRLLTRGEAAALVSRILGLAAPSKDYFNDDQGSTYENVINRLAESGIAKGCNPPLNSHFCPDRTMTRVEFAAMLTRGLGLQGPAPDAFSDDDGHWGGGSDQSLR